MWKATGSYHTYSSLVKLQHSSLSLRWKTCLWQNCSLGSCACSEGPALWQKTDDANGDIIKKIRLRVFDGFYLYHLKVKKILCLDTMYVCVCVSVGIIIKSQILVTLSKLVMWEAPNCDRPTVS